MTTAEKTHTTDPTVREVTEQQENWRLRFVEGVCTTCGTVARIHRLESYCKPRCNTCVMKLIYPGVRGLS